MARPQEKQPPGPDQNQPGLKVVDKDSGKRPEAPATDAAPQEDADQKARAAEAAARRRMHPPRVWPD